MKCGYEYVIPLYPYTLIMHYNATVIRAGIAGRLTTLEESQGHEKCYIYFDLGLTHASVVVYVSAHTHSRAPRTHLRTRAHASIHAPAYAFYIDSLAFAYAVLRTPYNQRKFAPQVNYSRAACVPGRKATSPAAAGVITESE